MAKYRPSKEELYELSLLTLRVLFPSPYNTNITYDAELRLAFNLLSTAVNHEDVIKSDFYKKAQTAEVLDMSNIRLDLLPRDRDYIKELKPSTTKTIEIYELLLAARIAAASPSIHTVNISGNELGTCGLKIAKILIKSSFICNVDMSNNDFTSNGASRIVEVFENQNNATRIKALKVSKLIGEHIPILDLIPMISDYLAPLISYNIGNGLVIEKHSPPGGSPTTHPAYRAPANNNFSGAHRTNPQEPELLNRDPEAVDSSSPYDLLWGGTFVIGLISVGLMGSEFTNFDIFPGSL